MDLRERLEGPGVSVELMPGTRILRLTRNELPFTGVVSMIGALDEFEAQIRLVDRKTFALLVDTRKAPAGTNPEFERAFRHFRANVVRDFARVAVLVETAEGLAQATAHADEVGPHMRAFEDEGAAVLWLLEVAAGRT